MRRSCGYGLLYEISRFKGRKAPEERYFLDHVWRIGMSIEFDSPSGTCEPFDVVEHLTTDRLKEKLGIEVAPTGR